MKVLAETFGVWSGVVTTYVNGEKKNFFVGDGSVNLTVYQKVEKNDTFKIALEGVKGKDFNIELSVITGELDGKQDSQ